MTRPGRVRPALRVGQRLLAATVGCYALTVATAACLSQLLPMSRSDAVLTSLLASFVIYAAAILWVFAVRSLAHMWWTIGGTTTGLAALLAMFRSGMTP